MTLLARLESRISLRVLAALLSAALHVGLFLLLFFSGGRYDGIHDSETPISRLVLIESRESDHREGLETAPLEPPVPTMPIPEQLHVQHDEPPSPLFLDGAPTPDRSGPHDAAIAALPALTASTNDTAVAEAIGQAASVVMPATQRAAVEHHLARVAEALVTRPRTHVTWEQDGTHFSAALVFERAKHGTEFDRVIADVSAEDRGKQLTTQIKLKRLPFSHYTQVIDHWDPMVQLHDDEIVGRMHINSRFNLMYDRRTAPKFIGKVTTSASTFNTDAVGRRREADIFRGGIETRAGRIALPEELAPFEWAPRDGHARVHEFLNDTRIRFFADGSYTWHDRNAKTEVHRHTRSEHPVYFIARQGAALYVKGAVSGQVLLYSPRRIVIEGGLTYARDPRSDAGSQDYLGLVCDKYIEVAPPHVTGSGDLDIHAAIFARRLFVVRTIDHPRSATLRIYGSLAAGRMSASEPRYAMKVEYDSRFEKQRPPGFPSTDRFAAEDWDGRWSESPQRSASDAF